MLKSSSPACMWLSRDLSWIAWRFWDWSKTFTYCIGSWRYIMSTLSIPRTEGTHQSLLSACHHLFSVWLMSPQASLGLHYLCVYCGNARTFPCVERVAQIDGQRSNCDLAHFRFEHIQIYMVQGWERIQRHSRETFRWLIYKHTVPEKSFKRGQWIFLYTYTKNCHLKPVKMTIRRLQAVNRL